MPNLSIIIPVLDEYENLHILTNKFALIKEDWEYIFVDDGSTDGTRDFLTNLIKENSKFKVIFTEKRLGHMGSYLKGLEIALAKHVVIMDGDLQHPPETIEKIANLLDNEYDIVVASRYNGKFFLGSRKKTRGIISRGAGLLLKVLVKECRGLSDPVSGFLGFRKNLNIPITNEMKGNKLLPFLVVANHNLNVGYVPYAFSERTSGKSKIVNRKNNFVLKFIEEVNEIRKVRNQIKTSIRD